MSEVYGADAPSWSLSRGALQKCATI